MTRKITALLLIMLLSFALLAGCGAKDADPEQKPPESTAPSLSESAEASSSEQPEPESSDDETSPESSEAAPVSPPAQFRLTFFYPECCRSFMVVPSLSGGEYIVSPSRSEKENLTKTPTPSHTTVTPRPTSASMDTMFRRTTGSTTGRTSERKTATRCT